LTPAHVKAFLYEHVLPIGDARLRDIQKIARTCSPKCARWLLTHVMNDSKSGDKDFPDLCLNHDPLPGRHDLQTFCPIPTRRRRHLRRRTIGIGLGHPPKNLDINTCRSADKAKLKHARAKPHLQQVLSLQPHNLKRMVNDPKIVRDGCRRRVRGYGVRKGKGMCVSQSETRILFFIESTIRYVGQRPPGVVSHRLCACNCM
jgi:hypothetical protein